MKQSGFLKHKIMKSIIYNKIRQGSEIFVEDMQSSNKPIVIYPDCISCNLKTSKKLVKLPSQCINCIANNKKQ